MTVSQNPISAGVDRSDVLLPKTSFSFEYRSNSFKILQELLASSYREGMADVEDLRSSWKIPVLFESLLVEHAVSGRVSEVTSESH